MLTCGCFLDSIPSRINLPIVVLRTLNFSFFLVGTCHKWCILPFSGLWGWGVSASRSGGRRRRVESGPPQAGWDLPWYKWKHLRIPLPVSTHRQHEVLVSGQSVHLLSARQSTEAHIWREDARRRSAFLHVRRHRGNGFPLHGRGWPIQG